jgi:hypothetical protein
VRNHGRNPAVQVANVIGDAIHELDPTTAADDALTIIDRSALKDKLALPRRIASTHERRSKAHHESGHAMAALEGGAQHIEARVREDGSGLCIARHVEDPEAGIVYSLAGVFAEIKFNPPAIHNFTHPACADFLIARVRIDALNASRAWPQMPYRTAAKNAMRFVEQHWRSIQNLALALNDAGELDTHAIRIFARCER